MLTACACAQRSSPRDLLERSVEAHGGRARLATLDNLEVVSHGRFKGKVDFTRRLSYRAPDAWRMRIDVGGVPVMAFGVNGARCWRKDRQFVSPCAEEDRAEQSRVTSVLTARFLHRLDASGLAASPDVDLEGQAAPALRAGDLQLVFDRKSRLLRQVRYGESVETFSEYRDVGGAMVGARRVLTIGGELDVEETWSDIRPGVVTPAQLAPPPAAAEGVFVDEVDFERPVAWTEVDDLGAAEQAVRSLEQFARAQGRGVSSSDGYVLIPPKDDQKRWQLAITLEAGAPLAARHQGALHLESWPSQRIAGSFQRGDPAAVLAKRGELDAKLGRRGLGVVPGARYQLLCAADCFRVPPAKRLTLLRVAVRPKTNGAPTE